LNVSTPSTIFWSETWNFSAGGFLENGPEEHEIRIQKILEFGIFVELLTQQFTAPSGIGVKIDENQLVIALGFGYCLV
jgi:hypothetical protein